jgi:hypothetical protein
MMTQPGRVFSDVEGDTLYVYDTHRARALGNSESRRVLSGETISHPEDLKQYLTDKLSMHSTSVTKAFRRVDTNYSGTLDHDEFRTFLEILNIHTTQRCYEEVAWTFTLQHLCNTFHQPKWVSMRLTL